MSIHLNVGFSLTRYKNLSTNSNKRPVYLPRGVTYNSVWVYFPYHSSKWRALIITWVVKVPERKARSYAGFRVRLIGGYDSDYAQ